MMAARTTHTLLFISGAKDAGRSVAWAQGAIGGVVGRGVFPLVGEACFARGSVKARGAAGGHGPDVVGWYFVFIPS